MLRWVESGLRGVRNRKHGVISRSYHRLMRAQKVFHILDFSFMDTITLVTREFVTLYYPTIAI